jgi:hypothetical protein
MSGDYHYREREKERGRDRDRDRDEHRTERRGDRERGERDRGERDHHREVLFLAELKFKIIFNRIVSLVQDVHHIKVVLGMMKRREEAEVETMKEEILIKVTTIMNGEDLQTVEMIIETTVIGMVEEGTIKGIMSMEGNCLWIYHNQTLLLIILLLLCTKKMHLQPF